MTSSGKSRLSLALRRNRARTLKPEFLGSIASAMHVREEEISLLSLEETDAAWAQLAEHRASLECGGAWASILVKVRSPTKREIQAGLSALQTHLGNRELLLHRSVSEFCGAVVASGADLISHAFGLVGLDEEGLLAADANGGSGLILEHVTDPVGFGRPTFLLLGWVGFEEAE